ncbi:50S ribosomal protein L24 [Candidatus Woesearchaeota archaeon]|nr:50S ribosomal protein L24 [Candidatus Woesearchaeota archaeon]
MKKISKTWKASKSPRKQRKFLFNAPLHLKNKMVCSHLSEELRKKYNTRGIRVRTGDKVKVLRGQFKGKTGKVEKINTLKAKAYVTGIEVVKRDGSKALYPIHSSNLLITDLNLSDKKRIEVKK